MKNIFVKIFSIVAISSLFLSAPHAHAGDTRWWFVDSTGKISAPHGGYTTKDTCEHDAEVAMTGITNPLGFWCATGTSKDYQDALKAKNQKDADDITKVNANTDNPVDESTYTLLAQLPGLKDIKTDNIGLYFNKIFLIAIGLCGALAVIMIVISGIQYMGDESVFGKTEAKGKILGAILGLFIALGAYALLKTIDPALLGGGGVHIDQAEIEVEEPIFSDEGDANIPSPKGAVARCTQGVDWVQTATVRFRACKSVWVDLQAIIAEAKKAGLTISGGGFRTYDEQVAARKRNGCPDIYKSPASACRVPAAIPGTSMHESGLAFDLKCNGSGIPKHTTTNACFIWLKNNTNRRLINLPSEGWHWSTTGH